MNKKMCVAESISALVGATPLLRAARLAAARGIETAPLLKLEYLNPTGSVKDRAALFMLEAAERAGRIAPGAVLIEPTSGNTGIGLAAIAASRGYRVVLTMPDSMSAERQKLLKAYGAELVLTPGAAGMQGAVEKAEALARETENSFIPSQFDNPANPVAHFETTGPEIFEQTDGAVDIFVAGIGTGGTVSGVGRYLRAQKKAVRIYGVEPAGSPLLTKGEAGRHAIQGIGANFVPKNLDRDVLDGVLTVTDEEAMDTARLIAKTEGILVGISAGAAAAAALRLLKMPENAGKTVVALLPDSGDRYLSTALFSE